MKGIVIFLLAIFAFTEVYSQAPLKEEESRLSALIDSFAVATVKKDKVKLAEYLSDKCKMYEPTGSTLDKPAIIGAFTQGVYEIKSCTAVNKSFKIEGPEATVTTDFNLEGVGNINGNTMDITGTYKFFIKLSKSDKGWQFSEISVEQS